MNIPKAFLTEAIAQDAILKMLAQGNTSDTRYTELAKWASEKHRQAKITNIDLSNIKISDRSLIDKDHKLINRYNTLGSLLNALYNIMKQESKHNKNTGLSSKIQKLTLEILEDLKAKEDDATVQSKEESNLQAGMDWTAEKAKRLADARETDEAISSVLDKFYNDYYSVEYANGTNGTDGDAGIIAKLKSLDKILIPEFNKLGYNPDVNPFASFLKILIKEKPDIFNKLTFNTYGAIHNSFIDQHITGNELGNYDEKNILFCSDLYKKNGLDIVEYLDLQKQARAAGKTSDIKDLIAKIFIQQNVSGESYSEKVKNLRELSKPIQPGKDTAKLRSLLEIQELYRYIFKAEAEKTKKKVDLKTVVDIVNKAEKQNIILDMIKLILSQNDYAGSNKYAAEAQKIDSWLDRHNHTYTRENIKDSRAILLNYKLDAAAMSLIINNLKNRIESQTEKKN